MQLFYSNQINNNQIVLDEVESRHCLKVLRKAVGDHLVVTDGVGGLFEAVIIEIQKKNVVAGIEKKTILSDNPHKFCHVAIAPTKNIDRFEWFLEKTTEIGIGRITPIICENSERKDIRTSRLKKILVSAMKQSLKTYIPLLDEAIAFNQFLTVNNTGNNMFIAHCQKKISLNLYEEYKKGQKTLILIGPEGDFSQREIKLAIEYGFKEISLGNSRLRTETAGVVACHSIVLKNEGV